MKTPKVKRTVRIAGETMAVGGPSPAASAAKKSAAKKTSKRRAAKKSAASKGGACLVAAMSKTLAGVTIKLADALASHGPRRAQAGEVRGELAGQFEVHPVKRRPAKKSAAKKTSKRRAVSPAASAAKKTSKRRAAKKGAAKKTSEG